MSDDTVKIEGGTFEIGKPKPMSELTEADLALAGGVTVTFDVVQHDSVSYEVAYIGNMLIAMRLLPDGAWLKVKRQWLEFTHERDES